MGAKLSSWGGELRTQVDRANAIMTDATQVKRIWQRVDFNGNGYVSLAEIDKMVVEDHATGGLFKDFNNKPALMRAYKASCSGGKNTDWIERDEFPFLLRNMYFFDKLWDVFDDIDTNDDRRVELPELKTALKKMGLTLTDAEAAEVFEDMDGNEGGKVLFDEFCKYVSNAVCDSKALGLTFADEPPAVKPPRKISSSSRKKAPVNQTGKKKRRKERSVREKFEAFEKDVKAMLDDKKKMHLIWTTLDFNGNGMVSLAEVDKMCVQQPFWQLCNNKPALMRAFKYTCSKVGGGDGDDYVQRHEFANLLVNIVYFNKLWAVFDDIDTGDDRRVDLGEFISGCCHLNMNLTVQEAEAAFDSIDTNGGGQVLFDEFCLWYRKTQMPQY
jgi:Ca2+-binding EF-hand superfamily protein